MDIKELKKIIKEFENSTIHKLEISEKDFNVKLEKSENKQYITEVHEPQIKTIPIKEENKPIENNFIKIKSPLVGVFYNAPSPDNPPYIKINQEVQTGDVLCIVEAMKVMNEIRSPINGIVKAIHVNNESMVEFNQVMIEIEAI
ncbi:MAG: acetyl-CoA carboxylase biotin carboxyl carrier protein [Candidatus Izemoplasmatales bacterium]